MAIYALDRAKALGGDHTWTTAPVTVVAKSTTRTWDSGSGAGLGLLPARSLKPSATTVTEKWYGPGTDPGGNFDIFSTERTGGKNRQSGYERSVEWFCFFSDHGSAVVAFPADHGLLAVAVEE